jgi:hypothetical protein
MTASLRRVSGINPAHFTPSSFSLGVKNVQETRPTRIQNAFAQSPVPNHTSDVEVFHHNQRVQQRIVMRDLEVKISSLALNLQVRFAPRSAPLLAAVAPLLASAQRPLFAPQGRLRGAEEARMRDGIAVTVGQERLRPTSIPTAGR